MGGQVCSRRGQAAAAVPSTGECLLFTTSSFYPPHLHKTSAATLSSCLPSSSSSALTNTICSPPPRLCSGHLWIPHARPSSGRSPGAVQWSLCSSRCAAYRLVDGGILVINKIYFFCILKTKFHGDKAIYRQNKFHIYLSKFIKRNIYLLFLFLFFYKL